MSSDEKMTTASSVSSKLKCMDVGIGRAEEEMDKHHLMARSHQPEPHTGGRRGSRRLKKKNPCDWPLTKGFTAWRRQRPRNAPPVGQKYANSPTFWVFVWYSIGIVPHTNQPICPWNPPRCNREVYYYYRSLAPHNTQRRRTCDTTSAATSVYNKCETNRSNGVCAIAAGNSDSRRLVA